MKRTLSSKILATAVFAAAALGAVAAAEARPDVQFSIGLPGVPVFVPPPPPVVLPGPAFLPPPPVVYEPGGWRAADRADFERERAWRQAQWQRREWERRDFERREAERRDWERRREWQRREWERHHDGRPPVYGRDPQ